MTRPRLLDLFCGAGGCSMGYHRAGFDVVGVDNRPMPRYPFEFMCDDALVTLRMLVGGWSIGPFVPSGSRFWLRDFDAIHASPPCQAHSSMKTMPDAKPHEDLIPATRKLLVDSGIPYVIENVPGAPLIAPALLCGTMFGLGHEDAKLRRHRLFESSFLLITPDCQHGRRETIGVYGGHTRNRRRRTIGVYGEGVRDSVRKRDRGQPDFGKEVGAKAMGIDWMTLAEMCQAIPPAYTEFIGRQLIGVLTP